MCYEIPISIIMPVYNGEEFLEEVIESVLQQSFTDFEFIIINDASTDRTEDIILKAAEREKRIVYLKNEKNSGVALSLNRGIDIAKGEYLARVDADDPIFRTRLEVQKEYMDSHPEVGVLATAYIYDNGQIEKVHIQSFIKKEDIKASFIIDNPIPHSTVMLRKTVMDDFSLRYDANYKLEDYELWTRAINYTEIAILKQPLIRHRDHPASVCKKMGMDFYNNINKIVSKFISDTYHVNIERYEKEHFYTKSIDLKAVVKHNRYKYAADEFLLLEEIESENRKVQFVDSGVLARILKTKWNWVIRSLKLEKVLPQLEENEYGSFRARLVYALVDRKKLKDENVDAEKIADYIKNILVQKKIIVYGAGVKCYDYFDPSSKDIDTEYAKVIAFCDKDRELIGGKLMGKRVIVPAELCGEDYDLIVVTSNKFFDSIKEELKCKYGIQECKIVKMNEFLS